MIPDNSSSEDKQLAEKIIRHSMREAARKFTYLKNGIYYLIPKAADDVKTIGADYSTLFYNPVGVIEMFEKEPQKVVEAIVHCVLHCMMLHPSYTPQNQTLFDMAADVSINAMTENDFSYNDTFRSFTEKCSGSTAIKIYISVAENMQLQKRISAITARHPLDDHSVWHKKDEEKDQNGFGGPGMGFMNSGPGTQNNKDEKSSQNPGKPKGDNSSQNKNNEKGSQNPGNQKGDNSTQNIKNQKGSQNNQILSGLSGADKNSDEKIWSALFNEALNSCRREYGNSSQNIFSRLSPPDRFSRFSYIEYLKQFAKEEIIQEDPETFDMMLYIAGLDMYNDMPVVEWNETREDMNPTDIIIAIDMSGSCDNEIASNFLRQVYTIFESMKSGNSVNIHVLTFDVEINKTAVITSKADAENFLKDYSLMGLGGTDFRCVFEYADSFAEKSFGRKLKGLFFFSDAYGSFPDDKKPYPTTFFVPDDGYDCSYDFVPDWIELVHYNDD